MAQNLVKISVAMLAIAALAPALIQGKAVPAAVQETLADGGTSRHFKYIGSMSTSKNFKGNSVNAISHYFLSTNAVITFVQTQIFN